MGVVVCSNPVRVGFSPARMVRVKPSCIVLAPPAGVAPMVVLIIGAVRPNRMFPPEWITKPFRMPLMVIDPPVLLVNYPLRMIPIDPLGMIFMPISGVAPDAFTVSEAVALSQRRRAREHHRETDSNND